MSRSRILVVLGLVVVAAGVLWFVKMRGRQAAPRYRTAAVELGDLTSTVSATGSVRPVVQVQVGSQVSGTISALRADYNSRVRAGQVLAQIEPSSFRTRVVQAEAALARADAALRDARRQYTRAQELLKGNFISQAEVDAAESVVAQRDADRLQANAQLASARLDLEHTTIHSPIDGVVISRAVDVGQTVAASLQAPELFVIANDLTQMQVETRIDEADIGRIHPDLPVRFTVDAFPDATFEGKVSQVRLEPITESNVVTYTTVMLTRNDDLRLRPGMTANVTVLVETRTGVLKVPNAALRFRPQGTTGDRAGGNRSVDRSADRSADRGSAASGVAQARTQPGEAERTNASAQGQVPEQPSARPAQERGRGRGGRQRGPGAWGARPPGAGQPDSGQRDAGRRGAGDPGAGPRSAWPAGDGSTARERTGPTAGTPLSPGTVYVLRDGKPSPVDVLVGITDGTATEIHADGLKPGDVVVVGLELGTRSNEQQLQPPPGMGGPQFRGGRGRR